MISRMLAIHVRTVITKSRLEMAYATATMRKRTKAHMAAKMECVIRELIAPVTVKQVRAMDKKKEVILVKRQNDNQYLVGEA